MWSRILAGGHVEVAQWLCDHARFVGDRHCWDNFNAACRKGHLAMAKWMYEAGRSPETELSTSDLKLLFLQVCMEGHLSVAVWLSGKVAERGVDVNYLHCHALASLEYLPDRTRVKRWLLLHRTLVNVGCVYIVF
jgi:hypothetical protein